MRKILFILLALLTYTGAWAAYVKVTNGTSVTWVPINGTIDGTNFTCLRGKYDPCISTETTGAIDLGQVWSGQGTGTHYTVTTIGEWALVGCTGLTSIEIPSSVTTIAEVAFVGYSGLERIKVDAGNTKYDSRNNCNAIIEKATNTLVLGCKNTVIPATVTSIGYGAFYGAFGSDCNCSGLTSIEIPSSVTSIGDYAFCGSALTTIELPSSVTSIGEYAFSQCYGLTSIEASCNIGNRVFEYCTNLTSVKLQDGVKSIGESAFESCTGLTSIEIPGSVTTIGVYAFGGCSGLTSITISEGVKNIEDCAFWYCKSLTSIVIPASVTNLGGSLFFECDNLETVDVKCLNASCEDGPFDYCNADVYVHATSVTYYRTSIGNYVTPKLYLNTDIATFSSDADLDFSNSHVRAYIITGYENGTLKTKQVTKIPAGTGVLLSGTAGEYTDISMATSTDDVTGSMLQPTDGTTTVPATEGTNTNFILTKTSDEKYTFVTLAEDGVIAQGKAYLPLPTESVSSNSFVIDFSSQTDGIKTATTAEDGNATIYDLQGRRVEKAAKGLYIVNGKKMLVK